MYVTRSLVAGVAISLLLAGCSAQGDNPGTEYAPNMYHSVPYEPLKQVTDEDAGRWVTSIEYPDDHAEYFNSNKLNPHNMNTPFRRSVGAMKRKAVDEGLALLHGPFEMTPAIKRFFETEVPHNPIGLNGTGNSVRCEYGACCPCPRYEK